MGHRDIVRHQQLTGRIARSMPEPRSEFLGLPQPGTRVRLVSTSDPHTNLQPGALGTVSLIDAMGTVHVNWDSGSGLGLIPGEDEWDVVS